MKFAVALSIGLAPVALAKAVHNVYPVQRDVGHDLAARSPRGSNSLADTEALLKEQTGLLVGSQRDIIIIWANAGGAASTTTINQVQTVTQTVTAGVAQGTAAATASTTVAGSASTTVASTGTTHSVTVGGLGASALIYEPDSITAAVGDMVVFTFMSKNHTVTQSEFATPCKALDGGMKSGFQPNPNNTISPPPQVAMQVMVDTPLWFYCAQTGHCGLGMVFSINPSANKTQAMFQQMAIAQNGTGAATPITGGTNSTTGGAASSSASLATTATATTAAATGVVTGVGSTNADGSCSCVVQCASGSFPAVQAQGLGAFGGVGGALF